MTNPVTNEDRAREIVAWLKASWDMDGPSLTVQLRAIISAALEDAVKEALCHANASASGETVSAQAPLQSAPIRDAIPNAAITIDYTNYRGERGLRRIVPQQIEFGSNKWHPEPQWLLKAWDCEKKAERLFAIGDIHRWMIEEPTTEATPSAPRSDKPA